MLHGAPGVGKLTTGKELKKLTGYPLFHNHLVVDMLISVFDFGTQPFADLRAKVWIDVMRRAAAEGLPGLIFTYVFEPTMDPQFADHLRQAVEATGGHLCPIELRCETEENLRRLQKPDRRAFLKSADTVLVRSGIDDGVYRPTVELPGNIIIDVTSSPPAETAQQIVDRLGL